ncbi:uncharacterized protein sb:cb288 isoform X2 [Mobula hypostoma]|uniref:uncharacterized protein sb:cb288 isoform X2 n=1 Tax=Mobula hypostoma TaxID=723540 RepID=UPI002FC31780
MAGRVGSDPAAARRGRHPVQAEHDFQQRRTDVTQVQKFHSVPNHSDGPSPASGLIPGMTAAAIFIVFLLGLYTILWKCMSFQTKRHRGSGRSKLRAAHVSC